MQVTHHHKDSDRPDEAFTTEHAKRKGLSNACSGRMRVTTAQHHFGPIGPEFDPERGIGLCVGDTWSSRLHCRQWGAHMPHVAGIAGQSGAGAQSIILSGAASCLVRCAVTFSFLPVCLTAVCSFRETNCAHVQRCVAGLAVRVPPHRTAEWYCLWIAQFSVLQGSLLHTCIENCCDTSR